MSSKGGGVKTLKQSFKVKFHKESYYIYKKDNHRVPYFVPIRLALINCGPTEHVMKLCGERGCIGVISRDPICKDGDA